MVSYFIQFMLPEGSQTDIWTPLPTPTYIQHCIRQRGSLEESRSPTFEPSKKGPTDTAGWDSGCSTRQAVAPPSWWSLVRESSQEDPACVPREAQEDTGADRFWEDGRIAGAAWTGRARRDWEIRRERRRGWERDRDREQSACVRFGKARMRERSWGASEIRKAASWRHLKGSHPRQWPKRAWRSRQQEFHQQVD